METLYDHLGGQAAIQALSEILYDRLLADEKTAPFFEGCCAETMIAKQCNFLSAAFGGPQTSDIDLHTAHAASFSKGLNQSHFDILKDHVRAILTEMHEREARIDEVMDRFEDFRKEMFRL